jgi:hypothetical protein
LIAGKDRAALPLVLLRFADWDALARVAPSDIDPTQDGLMMLPPTADLFAQVGCMHRETWTLSMWQTHTYTHHAHKWAR